MGRRGPAPEPTAAKLHRGETRPSRVNRLAPEPARGAPRMPRDLDERSQEVWRHVIRSTKGMDMISAADADVLRCFCEAVADYEEARALRKRTGLLVKGDHGVLVKTPLHQIVRDHRESVRLFSRELGLSPAARAGLQIEVGPAAGGDIDDEIGRPTRLRVLAGTGTDD